MKYAGVNEIDRFGDLPVSGKRRKVKGQIHISTASEHEQGNGEK